MQEPVEDCGGDDIVDKDLSPLLERLIGCDDDGSFLVTFGDELEEEFGRLLGEGQISQFVDDQKIDAGKILQCFVEPAGDLSAGQDLRELFGGEEEHALASLGGFDTEGDRQMGFPDTGWTDEQNVLGGLQEVE
jgi:hypothetical protein